MKNIDNYIVAPANRVALILFGGESIHYFAPRTIRLIDYTLCLKLKLGARFILILQKEMRYCSNDATGLESETST